MSRPGPKRARWAEQVLALEGGGDGDGVSSAAAAARVYDRVVARLTPLLGAIGVHALLRRSANLASGAFASLHDLTIIESSTKLRAWLQAQEPAVAAGAAVVVFATFFELLETFIGTRLTAQVLRGVWPALDKVAGEKKQDE